MTFAAAASTLVVVVAVLAGPSIISCSSAAEGLFACLRDQVVDAGLMPGVEPTPEPVAPIPATPATPHPAEVTPPVGPDLDLIRAEPDDHVIIAGSAEPGIEVEVFANGDLVGKVMAEASGDWVLVPDRPLATGTAEITAGIAGSNARSPHSFTVVIPEDKLYAPVITPSEPTGPPEPPPEITTEPEPLPAPVDAPAPKPEPTPPVQIAETEVAAPTPEPPVDVTPTPAIQPTIDAIEIDGSANYFAGAGPEGATVRLYVQNTFIAAAKVEGGRWLVETTGALTLPVQRIRIDLIAPKQAAVSARAEVNFVIDVPPPAPDMTVAGTGSGTAAPANSATGDVAFAPAVASTVEVDPTIPTLRALPAVAPEMMRFASGKAIIRRGETLWAIAARVYGDGSLYPRIVSANDELQLNPGRIFPGQVFDLPKLQSVKAAN